MELNFVVKCSSLFQRENSPVKKNNTQHSAENSSQFFRISHSFQTSPFYISSTLRLRNKGLFSYSNLNLIQNANSLHLKRKSYFRILCLKESNLNMEDLKSKKETSIQESSSKKINLDKVGVIIADHGSRRQESNELLNSFVDLFIANSCYLIVEPAHMEIAKPSIEDAFSKCVERGATTILIFPYFLSPGRHWKTDIPNLAALAAKAHPGISYLVSAPLGLHKFIADLANIRIQDCLSQALNSENGCELCQGTDHCRFRTAEEN